MRSIAQQSKAELGGSLSVLNLQKRDHIQLDALLAQLSETPAAEQGSVLVRIYRLVFPHAFAEESVLWPAIRRAVPDGHELTLRVEEEHQQINELVSRLQEMEPDSPDRGPLLDHIVMLLGQDVRDEEDALLPSLQRHVGEGELRLLGVAWEIVRRMAPTRPHPLVSRRPPGNVLSALPLSILDRCRDRLDLFRYQRPEVRGGVLEALSAALGRASRAVEHLPGMDRGEHASTRRTRPGSAWQAGALAAAGVAVLMILGRRRGAAIRAA